MTPSTSSRTWRLVFIALTAIALAHLLDHGVWQTLRLPPDAFRKVEGRDWYRFLRILGFWPAWVAVGSLLIASALALRSRSRDPGRAGSIGLGLILSSGVAGGLAELAKLIIRRGRPGETGAYTFDWPLFSLGDPPALGTVSSHAAVAFGAAFLLARTVPGAGWIGIPLAIGCGVTRLIAGAHFLTDVLAAGVIGYAVSVWMSGLIPPIPGQSAGSRGA